MSLIPFLATVAWLVFINWALGWFRRQREVHRKRLLGNGYLENNPGRRLRGDMYMRIAAIIYIGVGLVAYLWASEAIPHYAPAMARIVFPVLAMLLIPIFPALFSYVFARMRGEYTHPQGDLALKMRDLQFHKPGQPVAPNGEHGTAEWLDPRREGLVERLGFGSRVQPIVEQEAK